MAQRIEIKPNGEWIFHGGDDGDSRLRDPEKNAVPNFRVWNPLYVDPVTGERGRFEYQVMYHVYCRSCGADGGLSARTTLYVVYLCENCYARNQDPNFVAMPPDEEYRWRYNLPSAEEEARIAKLRERSTHSD